MSIDLNKLANKLDKALSNETSETLNKFLTDKRINNNKQSSVEWFSKESWNLKVKLENKEISIGEYGVTYVDLLQQAKAMHKEEVTSFTADWSIQYKYENGKNINQFYNETFNQ